MVGLQSVVELASAGAAFVPHLIELNAFDLSFQLDKSKITSFL
jgi:hypothetical protein